MLYKLTDKDGLTQNGTQWGEGVTHKADTSYPADLCSPGVLHAYHSPLLAVLLNPIHAEFPPDTMRLWEATGDVVVEDGLKVGCRSLTTIREIPVPVVTLEMRARFGILAALEVVTYEPWIEWANKWLDGTDRSEEAAVESARGVARGVARWAAREAAWT
ncbi:MAG: hypothetical protein OEW39_16250, partial [Deltaproteobacteria bacterium]|nr:hypothetical protein [Deltaproteobacteria bacterium]